jgi:hypothetical protein
LSLGAIGDYSLIDHIFLKSWKVAKTAKTPARKEESADVKATESESESKTEDRPDADSERNREDFDSGTE